MNKIKLYHFHNGGGGGVLAVIINLLKFSKNPAIENHVIYTINKEEKSIYPINNLEGAFSEQVFYYSPKWNFYYTCRQLAKLLPDEKALVVAHDWLELGMMSQLGLQNPVVYFLHGDYDYYYGLAQKHAPSIDQYICVAQNIETKLLAILPSEKDNIAYLRFPVPEVINKHILKNDCPIIFIGRLTETKGYPLLPLIAKALSQENRHVAWHIVGIADNSNDEVVWDKNFDVHFYGNISNKEVLTLLPQMKILLLPSIAEGMPVVVIEAMKAGVIPLVNNINGGIQELVEDAETGYKINDNVISSYAEKIILLMDNKILAEKMKINCIDKANAMFEPFLNTLRIESVCGDAFTSVKNKQPIEVYGSRLDRPWLSNNIVLFIRHTLLGS